MSLSATAPEAIRGLPPVPLLGSRASLLRFFRDPVGILQRLHREYGAIAALSDGDPSLLCAFGAAHNRTLLADARQFHNFVDVPFKVPPTSAAARFAVNLTTMNGPTHRRQRRLMMPAFHKQAIRTYRDDMVAEVERHLARWPTPGTVDVAEAMRELTLAVMMRCLFGLDVGEQAAELGRMGLDFITQLTSLSIMLFPVPLPGTPYSRFLNFCERFEARLLALIQERRAMAGDRMDALSILINTHDEDGTALTDEELVGQAALLFVAGHETTAFALAWTLFLLSQHPQVAADLRDELDGALHGAAPTVAQLAELPLLDGVVKESMRLLPPTPFLFTRKATADFRLGRYDLPAGTQVILSPLITHRLPDVYAEPTRFRPGRWAHIKPTAFEYLPFGAGPRMCLGAGFAALETRLVLALIVQRFRFALRPGADVSHKVQGITLGPKHGLPMQVREQDGAVTRPGPVRGTIHDLVDLPS